MLRGLDSFILIVLVLCADSPVNGGKWDRDLNDDAVGSSLYAFEQIAAALDSNGNIKSLTHDDNIWSSAIPLKDVEDALLGKNINSLYMSKMDINGIAGHIIMVGRDRKRLSTSPDVVNFIFVTQRKPIHTAWYLAWYLIVVIALTGILTAISLYSLVLQLGKEKERTQRGALLRNVQIGIIETTDGRMISYSNDRAEEILGVPLNRFGQSSKDPIEVDFFTRIDNICILGHDDKGIRRANLDDIENRRKLLRSSAYVGRIVDSDLYVKVVGSPWITPLYSWDKNRTPKTYGTIDVISKEEYTNRVSESQHPQSHANSAQPPATQTIHHRVTPFGMC
ncbi:hypothetical protein ACNOYE_19980 [Nannocystaceae bacterium ST9]